MRTVFASEMERSSHIIDLNAGSDLRRDKRNERISPNLLHKELSSLSHKQYRRSNITHRSLSVFQLDS